ncbi:5-methylcytosine-specific restriction endonuclease McrA [Mycoplana sp. BE70]|uniref:HNH endonuclease n=1 Tax=Mycoplana sp. BE70 TaxID=2817775 RepID=UPI0028629C9A|nr:HNH endonuclease [Mycoplana sp. BE70]MDR6757826.1 5-methylcytosine-specific restriction endonuclease McrA [Mycoplana sp. BE70]
MARLSTLRPRLSTLAPRIGRAAGDEQARLRERDQTVAWRSWYKTSRWQKLRQKILLRDNYTCQQTGVMCVGKHPADNSPVIDHKIPHRGDERLFWDEDNLQVVSKAYHDSEKQKQERAQALW